MHLSGNYVHAEKRERGKKMEGEGEEEEWWAFMHGK